MTTETESVTYTCEHCGTTATSETVDQAPAGWFRLVQSFDNVPGHETTGTWIFCSARCLCFDIAQGRIV